ncbi:glycosyltransferase family 4 protein [Litorimonas sp.]|uniref:glycosyltransferase family 4 protein n=1 Tax=Litorimonas sp. TaxID=1892381 RepID=UPI003A8A6BCF
MSLNQTDKPVIRVLQILPALEAGGVERTTVDIVEALTSRGHAAHVLSAGGRLEKEIEELGGQLHTSPVGSKNILTIISRIFQIRKLIKDNDINIVHARSRAPAWPAYFAAKLTRTPFVTTYHGIYNAKTWPKRFYNSIMARGNAVIANSTFTRDHIVKVHGLNKDSIAVIPRGVDMDQFDPIKVSHDAVTDQRNLWGGPHDKFIVLPGRLTRWKGQLDAVDALADLPNSCRLILVGDAQGRDNYVSEIEDRIKALKLGGRVTIEGHRSDMPLIYASAHVVLSASNEPEAFGRVAAEAQAMGRPVVATALGGALETVEDGKTGWLVPAGDLEAMAKAIKRALAWPAYDSRHARTRIMRYFSRKSLQARVLAVYSELLTAKNR